mmetsp:Transcript_5862/g.18894  ORF Transcript_5862/g.18894 Transcript_5862/m.18894 type:complete len:121 (+) Transcript_5862:110-472(+)
MSLSRIVSDNGYRQLLLRQCTTPLVLLANMFNGEPNSRYTGPHDASTVNTNLKKCSRCLRRNDIMINLLLSRGNIREPAIVTARVAGQWSSFQCPTRFRLLPVDPLKRPTPVPRTAHEGI